MNTWGIATGPSTSPISKACSVHYVQHIRLLIPQVAVLSSSTGTFYVLGSVTSITFPARHGKTLHARSLRKFWDSLGGTCKLITSARILLRDKIKFREPHVTHGSCKKLTIGDEGALHKLKSSMLSPLVVQTCEIDVIDRSEEGKLFLEDAVH